MSYNISTNWVIVLTLAALWELVWKGVALWKAGRNKQKAWFVAILVINTVGILPIWYLVTHQTKRLPDGEPF